MSDYEFFDDSFEPSKPKGKFHHHIINVNSENMPQMALFFMNNKNDVCFKNGGLNFYFCVQYSPSMGKPADYIEKTRGTSASSNVLEQVYLNYSPIFKTTEDGLITTIDSVATLSAILDRPVQNITIHQGGGLSGCEGSGCGKSSEVEAKMREMQNTIDMQNITIQSLAASLKTVESIASELGVKEIANQLFERLPNKAQIKALYMMMMQCESLEEFNLAFEHSKMFQNILDAEYEAVFSNLKNELSSSLSDVIGIIELTTHADSIGGSDITEEEMPFVTKNLSRLRKNITDLTKYVNERKRKD